VVVVSLREAPERKAGRVLVDSRGPGCFHRDITIDGKEGKLTSSVGRSGSETKGVVVADVGGEATDGAGLASIVVDLGEDIGGLLDVGGPSEPAGVSGIEVLGNVGKVEVLQGVRGGLVVGGLSTLALSWGISCPQLNGI
jgi:hypothetical protein